MQARKTQGQNVQTAVRTNWNGDEFNEWGKNCKRQRQRPLGGSGACPPPPRKFWNLKALKRHFQHSQADRKGQPCYVILFCISCVTHHDCNSEFCLDIQVKRFVHLITNIMIIKQKQISLLVSVWELIFKIGIFVSRLQSSRHLGF